jgi:2,4-dienoyl-CoA reductase-like NADH-dependent reductase (Old Yellow Enzyme family)
MTEKPFQFDETEGTVIDAGATAFPLLLSPFAIGKVELRNRFVFQPHFTALGGIDGMPSDAHAAYHEERARGGVGLIVFESQAIHPSGKMSRRFVDAWDPKIIPHHRKVTDAVHAHGAKIFGQLTHGGHTSLEQPAHLLWAPTQMPEPSSHVNTKAIDEDDIAAVIEGFATSSRNLVEAGFDGIEIKIAHDGLLRSFASPFFNRRTDAYGGTFEKRMRLSMEVMQAIKFATGSDIPLGVRLCVNEFTTFGYDTDYGLQMAEHLQASGLVDYFNSDAGSFSSYWMEIPPAAVAAEDFRKINKALKAVARVPVVAFGRMNAPQIAEEVLKAREADLIGMARQLIADPWTAEKTRNGRADLVRRCISCNDGCIHQVGQEKGVRCIQNPGAGRERDVNERLLSPVSLKKHVIVIGGGPAGMKVAETAARRGHRVTLFERNRALGGQLLLAEKQPEHAIIGEVTSHLEIMLNEYGVDVRRGQSADIENIHGLSPDVVVVATGSEPNLPRRHDADVALSQSLGRQVLPDIAGLHQDFVVSSDDVMSGSVTCHGHVVVIDNNGHWEAAGTAEFLADAGCSVTVVANHAVGSDLEAGTRTLFYRRAAIKNMMLRSATSLVEVGDHRVVVTAVFSGNDAIGWAKYILMPGDEQVIDNVDWVVPVIGRRSREDLFLKLKADPRFAGVRIERTGDCVAPRLVQSNISEAFLLAQTL